MNETKIKIVTDCIKEIEKFRISDDFRDFINCLYNFKQMVMTKSINPTMK